MKRLVSVVAAVALVLTMGITAMAAVASPTGGATTETTTIRYTTQAQTGKQSDATAAYNLIAGCTTTTEELNKLEAGLADRVTAALGNQDVEQYSTREIGEVYISNGGASVTVSKLTGVTASTTGFGLYKDANGHWQYMSVTYGKKSATFTVPYSTTVVLYVKAA